MYYRLFKASDGVNEYVAVSSNGGRLWRLVSFVCENFLNQLILCFHQSSKGNGYLTAISNPNALIVTVSNNNQQSSNSSFR
jgi:hypothetical protein